MDGKRENFILICALFTFVIVSINAFNIEFKDGSGQHSLPPGTGETRAPHDVGIIEIIIVPEPGTYGYTGGEVVDISAQVKNFGTNQESGFELECTITDPASKEIYFNSTTSPPIDPGDQSTVHFPLEWVVPSSPSGDYDILVSTNLTGDGNTTNDGESSTVFSGQAHDVSFEDLVLNPTPQPGYGGGEVVNVSVITHCPTIWGASNVTANCRVISPSDQEIYNETSLIEGMGATESASISLPELHVPNDPKGNYFLAASVNCNNDLLSGNNDFSMEFEVKDLTNLRVEDLFVSPIKETYAVGESVSLGGTITNTGSTDVLGDVYFSVLHNTEEIYNETTEINLTSKQTATINSTGPLELSLEGSYNVTLGILLAGDEWASDNKMSLSVEAVEQETNVGIYRVTPKKGSEEREGEVEIGIGVKNSDPASHSGYLEVTLNSVGSGTNVFEDEFESSQLNWETDDQKGEGEWHSSQEEKYSGSRALRFGEQSETSYPEDVRSMLISPEINLKTTMASSMEFMAKYDLIRYDDYITVVIWDEVNRTDTIVSMTGESDGWIRYEVDISDFSGHIVRIGLFADTKEGDKSGHFGLFLDDLIVKGYSGSEVLNENTSVSLNAYESKTLHYFVNLSVGRFSLAAKLYFSGDSKLSDNKHVGVFDVVPASDLNVDPVSIISEPVEGAVFNTTVPVTFNGTSSYDMDGDPLEYKWIINSALASGEPCFTHIFIEPGSYSVKLTVSDPYGGIGNFSITIYVQKKSVENLTKSNYKTGYVSVTLYHLFGSNPALTIDIDPPVDESAVEENISDMSMGHGIFFSFSITSDNWHHMEFVVNYASRQDLVNITNSADLTSELPAVYRSTDMMTWKKIAYQEAILDGYTIKCTIDNISPGTVFSVFTTNIDSFPPIIRLSSFEDVIDSGELLSINASNSYDPDVFDPSTMNSTVLSIRGLNYIGWDINGDGSYDVEGPVVNRRFYNNGSELKTIHITILVIDSHGKSNITTVSISINPEEQSDDGKDKETGEASQDNTWYYLAATIAVIALIMFIVYLQKRKRKREWEEYRREEEEREEELTYERKQKKRARRAKRRALQGAKTKKAKDLKRKGGREQPKVPIKVSAKREEESLTFSEEDIKSLEGEDEQG